MKQIFNFKHPKLIVWLYSTLFITVVAVRVILCSFVSFVEPYYLKIQPHSVLRLIRKKRGKKCIFHAVSIVMRVQNRQIVLRHFVHLHTLMSNSNPIRLVYNMSAAWRGLEQNSWVSAGHCTRLEAVG